MHIMAITRNFLQKLEFTTKKNHMLENGLNLCVLKSNNFMISNEYNELCLSNSSGREKGNSLIQLLKVNESGLLCAKMNCYTSEKRPLQFFRFEICIVNIILRFSHIVSFFRVAAPKHINVTNGSGRTGTTTELSCTYEGRPLPTIKWLGFGKDLTQVWLFCCNVAFL